MERGKKKKNSLCQSPSAADFHCLTGKSYALICQGFSSPMLKNQVRTQIQRLRSHDNPEKNETDSAFFIFKETKSGFYALLVYG